MNTLTQTEPPAPEPGVQDRSTEFVPVEGGGETTSAEVLLVSAYAVMWVLVFLFVWLTARRQRSLDARLGEVEQALGRLEDGPPNETALTEGHHAEDARSPA